MPRSALAVLFYLLAFGSAWILARRLPLARPFARLLATLAFGAAQIVFLTEALSLPHLLKPWWMMGGQALLAVLVVVGALRLRRPPPPRAPLAPALRRYRRHPGTLLVLLGALAVIAVFASIGFAELPMSDEYHYAMPLYWRQHASILPFPVPNPRTVGFVFGSEALCFPGLLLAQSQLLFAVTAGGGAMMCVLLIQQLALPLRVPFGTAAWAGALFCGYLPVLKGLLGPAPDLLLPAMWVGASLWFLLESWRQQEQAALHVGLALFTLLLGCGTKNIVVLQGPCWLLLAVVWWRLGFRRWANLPGLCGWLALGLLCSSLLWSYASNWLWFGNLKGPLMLQRHLSSSWAVGDVWSRLVRASVSSFLDPLWLPRSLQPAFARVLAAATRVLGGHLQLPEDDAFFSFTGECLRPNTGWGPLGLVLFVPGLAAAFLRFRSRPSRAFVYGLILGATAIGSMMLCFAILRWQRIGLARLLVSCLLPGAPLAALPCRRRWFRALAGSVWAVSILAALVAGLGVASRRLPGAEETWWARQISRLQNPHAKTIHTRWQNEPPGHFSIAEDFSARELYAFVLARVPAGSAFGFLAGANSQEYYLFGSRGQNQVWPLIDARNPSEMLPISAQVDYLLEEGGSPIDLETAPAGFTLWLELLDDSGARLMAVWRRSRPAV